MSSFLMIGASVRLISTLLSLLFFGIVIGAGGLVLGYQHFSQDLPDYAYLKDYHPPQLSRVYADDGRMLATFASEQRVFAAYPTIPKRVIQAFISAEDQDFFQHNGIDPMGIARAILVNIENIGRSRRPMGASTITQQVAKNLLLTNEVSVGRKVREMILATRLEKALTKERILEIYLNEIFLGNRSYGIVAAALNYFNKSLDELTVAEAAYLAALPKAPSNYNPVTNYAGAMARRNWVVGRMAELGYVTPEEALKAIDSPIDMRPRDDVGGSESDYFAEEVRRQLVSQFGDHTVLEGGLAVKTSLNPAWQSLAAQALRDGLIDYDRRARGWRGPVAHMNDFNDWQRRLAKTPQPPGSDGWHLAVVGSLRNGDAQIAFPDNKRATIPFAELKWARREFDDGSFGAPIKKAGDVLAIGDIVLVEPIVNKEDGKPYPANSYTLRQIPQVQGALVALDPHTGRVYAMSGGFSARISQFNRATQALRQPGSSFKPFVYMAALDKGFTPSSLVLDAPFEYDQGPGLPLWKPENYSQQFYGPTPLRVGIEKSRNVMTVRLANAIGMPVVVDYAKKFGIVDDMPALLSFSLGAKETTPIRMAAAYGMIVNGGKKITPSLIDRVSDIQGKTLWRADVRDCGGCQNRAWSKGMMVPDIPDTREQVEDARTAYQMTSIMQGVVQRGTAIKLNDLPFPVAGKTGTTNDSKDAWFVGFTPDLVVAVYIGFDDPKPLGSHETGASLAVPIFKTFMQGAMVEKPAIPFRVPQGLRMVRVNPETGALAEMGDQASIWEAFVPGTEPQEGQQRIVLDGSVTGSVGANGVPDLRQGGGAVEEMPPVVIGGDGGAATGAVPGQAMAPDPHASVQSQTSGGGGAQSLGTLTLSPTGEALRRNEQPSPVAMPRALPGSTSPSVGSGGLY